MSPIIDGMVSGMFGAAAAMTWQAYTRWSEARRRARGCEPGPLVQGQIVNGRSCVTKDDALEEVCSGANCDDWLRAEHMGPYRAAMCRECGRPMKVGKRVLTPDERALAALRRCGCS